jgi:hypothetical protein
MNARFRSVLSGCLFLAVCAAAASAGLAADDKSDKPMNMAGTWRWKWTDAKGTVHHHVLEVEGEGKTLSARERFDDGQPVKVNDLAIDGKTVTFSVTRGALHAAYKGKFKSADHIDGTVNTTNAEEPVEEFGWSADRDENLEDAKSRPD